MMSGLKTPEGIFLDLLYLAETGSNFFKQTIPESIFIDYLKLSGSYKELKQKVDQSFEGITKERFLNEHPTESWPHIEHKIEVFSRKMEKFDYEDDGFSNYHQFEDEYLKNAYQYYCDKTGHIHGKPISTKTISDRDSIKMVNMMESIGEAILLKERLEDVRDQLEFDDVYTSSDKVLVESPSLACSKVYYELYDGEESVDSEKLKQRVLERYKFKIYADSSTKVALQNSKKAVREWIRRNKREKSDFSIK